MKLSFRSRGSSRQGASAWEGACRGDIHTTVPLMIVFSAPDRSRGVRSSIGRDVRRPVFDDRPDDPLSAGGQRVCGRELKESSRARDGFNWNRPRAARFPTSSESASQRRQYPDLLRLTLLCSALPPALGRPVQALLVCSFAPTFTSLPVQQEWRPAVDLLLLRRPRLSISSCRSSYTAVSSHRRSLLVAWLPPTTEIPAHKVPFEIVSIALRFAPAQDLTLFACCPLATIADR